MNNSSKHLILTLMFIGILMFSGCLSMSSLQTGRTMGKGQFGGGFSGGYYSVEVLDKDNPLSNQVSDSEGIIESPFGELYLKYGLTDRLDVSGKISVYGVGNLEAKYRFLGTNESKGALSVGLGFGGIQIDAYNIFEAHLPVYLSYHPAKWLAVYSTPRYVFRVVNGNQANWLGVTGGIRLGGKKIGVFCEYTHVTNGIIKPTYQLALGLGINIK